MCVSVCTCVCVHTRRTARYEKMYPTLRPPPQNLCSSLTLAELHPYLPSQEDSHLDTQLRYPEFYLWFCSFSVSKNVSFYSVFSTLNGVILWTYL